MHSFMQILHSMQENICGNGKQNQMQEGYIQIPAGIGMHDSDAAHRGQSQHNSCHCKAAAEQADCAKEQPPAVMPAERAHTEQHGKQQFTENGKEYGHGRQKNQQCTQAAQCGHTKTSAHTQSAMGQPCGQPQQYVIHIQVEHKQHIQINRLHEPPPPFPLLLYTIVHADFVGWTDAA
jgi:hypothetical protein